MQDAAQFVQLAQTLCYDLARAEKATDGKKTCKLCNYAMSECALAGYRLLDVIHQHHFRLQLFSAANIDFSASQLFLPQTRVFFTSSIFSASWLVFSNSSFQNVSVEFRIYLLNV